jgi:hypothetical protein
MNRESRSSEVRIGSSLRKCRKNLLWAGVKLRLSCWPLGEKDQVLGIDDKNGINACKLLSVAFTTAMDILVRMWEKRLLTTSEALAKLEGMAKHGRYKESILEEARCQLETSK